ncbi:MAG: PilZ domain-containing protein [Elusimicrobia bacterium]|nr:PilZ domain-containing protein [Elusimicrobiota bacterium]
MLRADGRAATDFVVEVYHSDGKTLKGISRLLDLSVSGACVESTSDWNEGDDVHIRVLLDRGTLLALPAQVLWKRLYSRTHRYGLKFREYPAAIGDILRKFVGDFEEKMKRLTPKKIRT